METRIKTIPGRLREIKGDVCQPYGPGLIIQIVNDLGAYGAGVSGAIAKRWKKAEVEYKRWSQSKDKDFKLGSVQFVYLDPDFEIANMVAQRGLRGAGNPTPLQYDALAECLGKVSRYAKENNHKRVHAPKGIGAGLAGGDWEKIKKMMIDGIVNEGLELVTYELS